MGMDGFGSDDCFGSQGLGGQLPFRSRKDDAETIKGPVWEDGAAAPPERPLLPPVKRAWMLERDLQTGGLKLTTPEKTINISLEALHDSGPDSLLKELMRCFPSAEAPKLAEAFLSLDEREEEDLILDELA